MALQPNINARVVYKAESAFGTAPANTGGQILRRVRSSLVLNKDGFAPNEVRSDAQVADYRHGSRSVRGSIEGELSTATYDDLIEAAVRGTWATGVSCAPADFATGVTPNGTSGTFTFAGAGSLITKGFKIGDVVAFTGLTGSNTTTNFRIVGLTATVMTVMPKPTTQAQVAAGWTCAVRGKKLLFGLNTPSFTFEQAMPDVDVSKLLTGCRVGGFALNAQPNGNATISFDVLGQNQQILTGASSPYFPSPSVETTTGVLTAIDGSVRVNGSDVAIATALQINMTNNLSNQQVIGSTYSPDIFYGKSVVTGTLSAFLADETLINVFLNESNIDVAALMSGPAAATLPDFLGFSMQNVKFTGCTDQLETDGGVIAQFPFQALLKTGGAATTYDQSTLVIQRSN
jgi:hypothetical protein